MKLIQLNAWSGRLTLQVCRFLKEQDADILCLQEIYGGTKDLGGMLGEEFGILEYIQDATGLPYTFMSPTWTIDVLDQIVPLGNAILSRFPLEQQTTDFINGELFHKVVGQDAIANTRNLQTAQVVIGDKRLTLANHHAFWDISPMGNETSVEKMRLVRSKLEDLPKPLIFSGDLNVKSESPAMRVWDGFLEDLTAKNNITTTLSILGKVSDVACDHILISDDVKVSSFQVADDLISDHKALILEFDI